MARIYRKMSFLPLVAVHRTGQLGSAGGGVVPPHEPEPEVGEVKIRSEVNRVRAASSEEALKHFEARLTFETDCWDVHHSLTHGPVDFVVFDVRSRDLYEAGHVPGAINVRALELTEERLTEYPPETLFVVYCSGPHCNGANKAAIRLARLGRPVKEMIGGVEGWKDEGFTLTQAAVGAV